MNQLGALVRRRVVRWWRAARRCGLGAAAGSVRPPNGRGHGRVGAREAFAVGGIANACAEAPRLLTLAAGRGLGGRGRGWEVAQGVRQALPGWHRRLWSVRRRGARQLRRVRRRAGRCRPHARWSVGAMGRRRPGRCFERPVRWLRELGVLPRRPFRPRPRTLPAPGSAPHLPAALWSRRSAGLCAPTRWPSEGRRGHGRRGHTFGDPEGGERPAHTRSCGLPLAGSHPRRPLRTWLLFWSGGSASACDGRQLS